MTETGKLVSDDRLDSDILRTINKVLHLKG